MHLTFSKQSGLCQKLIVIGHQSVFFSFFIDRFSSVEGYSCFKFY